MKPLRLDTKVDLSRPRNALARWRRGIGQWFLDHIGVATFVVILLGLVAQAAATWDRSLSPDEALHFILVNVPGTLDAYRNVRPVPHPPLFFLVLQLWTRLGHSELFLRLLPAIFGGAFLWLTYRWAARMFGEVAGLLTVASLSLSAAWLPLSAEVRDYSLLLLLVMAALLEFERSAETGSAAMMLLSALFLYLAIFCHYSAVFVMITLAIYEFLRLRETRASRRVTAIWLCSQAGAVLVLAFLYFTQFRILRGGEFERDAMSRWLSGGYLRHGVDNPFGFAFRQVWAVYRYFFGPAALAGAAVVLAAGGVIVLARKRKPAIILVTLPFLLGATAGVLGLYPFSQNRYSAYLLPSAAFGIGASLSALLAGRRWTVLMLLGVFVCLSWSGPVWATEPHTRSQMRAAVGELRRGAPPGSVLFADPETRLLLAYYLDGESARSERPGLEGFMQSTAGSYCIVGPTTWNSGRATFGQEFERMVSVYRLPAGQPLWTIQLRSAFDPVSTYDPATALAGRFPHAFFLAAPRFGNQRIVEMWLGEEPEPREPG